VPCAALARGIRTGQAALPPFTIAAGSNPAFNDLTDNNPCGKFIVTNAAGTAYADNLCLPHLTMKYGQKTIGPP
jgi:hypothetical protein